MTQGGKSDPQVQGLDVLVLAVVTQHALVDIDAARRPLEAGNADHVLLVGRKQIAAAAYAACKALGVAPPVIAACLRSFPGLPHRQELLEVIDGVAYVNDSKATNPEAAAKALACYSAIFWIAGGRAKDAGLEPLSPFLARVVKAYLIGEAEDRFAAALSDRVAVERCGTLERAITAAAGDARTLHQAEPAARPVVLLSPACASFDQFPNFEARGDAFRAAVNGLPGIRSDLEHDLNGPGVAP